MNYKYIKGSNVTKADINKIFFELFEYNEMINDPDLDQMRIDDYDIFYLNNYHVVRKYNGYFESYTECKIVPKNNTEIYYYNLRINMRFETDAMEYIKDLPLCEKELTMYMIEKINNGFLNDIIKKSIDIIKYFD